MSNRDPIAEARKSGRTALDEQAGKALLAQFKIAVPQSKVVKNAADAAAAMKALRAPVVLKIMSPDILHKSDAGGVKVGLNSAEEVAAAIEAMAASPKIKGARIDG